MSDHSNIAILADLSMAAAATRKGARGVGRYARTPKFEAPAARSTRPNTGQGVTFHFAHKALSKRNDISDGYGTMTSASAHQGYIERREAGAALDTDSVAVLEKWSQEQGGVNQHQEDRQDAPMQAEGETTIPASFSPPPLAWSADRAGFGTLGNSPQERKAFWTKIETAERRNGRVQSRIIAELPHEATPQERMEIAVGFCKKLEEMGLPFWASIHAPTKKNDARNHHLHIAYSERPAAKGPNGEWDFEAVVRKKKANRSTITTRPYRQNRSAEVRKRDWVKNLRLHYSTVANATLEKGGYDKRLDPRSYRDSGVSKEPTRHLGFKAHAMETFGLDTKVGGENAEKETRWRTQARTQRWERALAVEDVSGLFGGSLDGDEFWGAGTDRRDKIAEGLSVATLGVQSEIMAERMGLRLEKRMDFLSKEGTRLLAKGRGLRIASAAQDIAAIDSEHTVLQTREDDVQEAIVSLERQARNARTRESEIWNDVFGESPTTAGLSLFEGINDSQDSFGGIPLYQAPKAQDPHPNTLDKKAIGKEAKAEEAKGEGQDKIDAQESSSTPSALPKNPAEGGPVSHTNASIQAPLVAFGLDTTRDQGLLLIDRLSNRQDVRKLDEALLAMSNKETRMRAIATRDLVDVLDTGATRDRANRGWVVLKAEAERRGLDLETGRHTPAKGTDRERAERHRDEYLASVLQVRQEVVIVQTR